MTNGTVTALFACTALVSGFMFAASYQAAAREDTAAFARDCMARGGIVRIEYSLRQCVDERYLISDMTKESR